MTSSVPDEYAPVDLSGVPRQANALAIESFAMDEVPTTAQQNIDRERALAPNLLPDNPPCARQLYPAGAVLQPLNSPYTANLINPADVARLWPQRDLQQGQGTYITEGFHGMGPGWGPRWGSRRRLWGRRGGGCAGYMRWVSVLLLIQLVLLILIWSRKC